MSIADFMAEALGHPTQGYYMTRDPLGVQGDFTTAPEISQVFGEVICAWFALIWQMGGRPDPFRLIELGPGRGTLTADILRVGKRLPSAPGFSDALQVHLVEMSPTLKAVQAETLKGHEVTWHARLEDIPDGPAFILANEFFDALPIHQLVRIERGWRERLITTTADGKNPDGGLAFTLSPGGTPVDVFLDEGVRDSAGTGAIAEVSPVSLSVMDQISNRVAQGGAALIIDYGHVQSAAGDTLQAMRDHAFVDPLSDPGMADLTAHVDFAALARVALDKNCTVMGPIEQGDFLTRLGAEKRATALIARAQDENQAQAIRAGVDRLVSREEMGSLFKVMGVLPGGVPPLPGFEE